MGKILEMRNLIACNVKDTELGVGLEAGDMSDGVMWDIELFQIRQGGKAGQACKAVGREGDGF